MAIPFLSFLLAFSSFSPFYLGSCRLAIMMFIVLYFLRVVIFLFSFRRFIYLVSFVVFRVTVLFNKIIATFAYLRGVPSSLTAKREQESDVALSYSC